MHPSILAGRRNKARDIMVDAVEELADQGRLSPEVAVKVSEAGFNHDRDVDALYKEEAVAEALAELASGPAPGSLSRQEIADVILNEVEGLTKTSREAITSWIEAEEA